MRQAVLPTTGQASAHLLRPLPLAAVDVEAVLRGDFDADGMDCWCYHVTTIDEASRLEHNGVPADGVALADGERAEPAFEQDVLILTDAAGMLGWISTWGRVTGVLARTASGAVGAPLRTVVGMVRIPVSALAGHLVLDVERTRIGTGTVYQVARTVLAGRPVIAPLPEPVERLIFDDLVGCPGEATPWTDTTLEALRLRYAPRTAGDA